MCIDIHIYKVLAKDLSVQARIQNCWPEFLSLRVTAEEVKNEKQFSF
jgi:hypothetical protein